MAQTIKTFGIVLRSNKHTIDAARRLDIFSPELGRFYAVIRGVEKPKAKLAAAAQPFCFGELLLAERGGFYTVTDCDIQDSFFSLAYNLDCYVLGSSLLEVVSHVAQEGESNPELFTLLLKALKALAYEHAEPTATAIKFMLEVLKLSGFGMALDVCEQCGKPLDGEGLVGLVYTGSGALCQKDRGRADCVHLSQDEWETLRAIKNSPIDDLSKLSFSSRAALTSCLGLILKQFYFRTGEEIRSLDKYLGS